MNNVPGIQGLGQQQDTLRVVQDSSTVQRTDSSRITIQRTSRDSMLQRLEQMMEASDKRLQQFRSQQQTQRKPSISKPEPAREPIKLTPDHLIFAHLPSGKEIINNTTAFYPPDSSLRPTTWLSDDVFLEGTKPRKYLMEKHHPPGTGIPHTPQLMKENWMFPVLLCAFILLTISRLSFLKLFRQTVVSLWDRKAALSLQTTRSSIYQTMGFLLFLNSLLTISLFTYLFSHHFGLFDFQNNTFRELLTYSGATLIFFIYMWLTSYLTGAISGTRDMMKEFFDYSIFFFHSLGIYLFPFAAIAPFVPLSVANTLLIIGCGLGIILYFLRLFWLTYIFIRQNLSPFYLFLYLCALEILPVLIVFRLLFS